MQKFAPDASYLGKITIPDRSDAHLEDVMGIAVGPDGSIYAANEKTGAVLTFDPAGYQRASLGSKGRANGQFTQPRFIAIDRDKLYVSDRRNRRVEVLGLDGTFTRTIGSSGKSDGQFTDPEGVGLDANHNTYVADGTRIEKFSAANTFISSISIPQAWYTDSNGRRHRNVTLSNLQGIAVDAAGDVFAVDANNGRVVVFKPLP